MTKFFLTAAVTALLTCPQICRRRRSQADTRAIRGTARVVE